MRTLSLLFVVALAASAAGCKTKVSEAKPASPTSDRAAHVETAAAETHTVPVTLSLSGALEANRSSDVAADAAAAKPKRPYRLIDICDPSESYNAGRFVRDARAAMAEVERPLFVGGTALYYKALVYGIFEGPEADPQLRDELVALGAPALHAELRRVDPPAAAKIHPNDLKRLVRAVEVFRKTGEPISSKHTHFDAAPTLEADVFVLAREDIKERIAARTKRMLAAGLVDEVKSLLARPWGKEGRRAVGYREVIGFLDGEYDAAEMERLINRNTNTLARHQRMWFKRFAEARWVSSVEELCARSL